MTAQRYEVSTAFTKDDMERVRAFLLHAVSCRTLSFCAPTPRNMEGERFVTGFTLERLHLGIDVHSMFERFGNTRRERLLDWAFGVRPFLQMPPMEQVMLREDMLRLRSMAQTGGYAYLLGLDARVE